MSGPKTSAAISAHLDQAAAGSSGVCTRLSWAAGSAGASAGYGKIAAATAAGVSFPAAIAARADLRGRR